MIHTLLRKLSPIPFLMLCLSMVAAKGPCWWDDYHPPPSHATAPAAPCGYGEQVYQCNCRLRFTSGSCHQPTHAQCALTPDQARGRAQLQTIHEADGASSASCACAKDGDPPPEYPKTAGGADDPLCSDVMGTDAPTCSDSGTTCDTAAECCSKSCSLSICD